MATVQMDHSSAFFRSVLDSIKEHIVIIDQTGLIQYVNTAWNNFSAENGCTVTQEWVGVNYLAVCDEPAAKGDSGVQRAAAGIRSVINAKTSEFYFEYPCHSPKVKRWFTMRVTPLNWPGRSWFTLSHQDITHRRLAEDAVRTLSLVDSLTGVANRRHFDDFLKKEWLKCGALNIPLSIILLDIDYFKLFNDSYGHLAGDSCLKQISEVLKLFCTSPDHLCARYGGEEFALILSGADLPSTSDVAGSALKAIQVLAINHNSSPSGTIVTASLGVATMHPCVGASAGNLISAADKALYRAKDSGRNQVYICADRNN